MDWAIYAAVVVPFTSRARVREVASVRRSGLRSDLVSYCGVKRDERWVTREFGRYTGEWILWLCKTLPGKEILVGGSSCLEEGMARLLQGIPYADYWWHS